MRSNVRVPSQQSQEPHIPDTMPPEGGRSSSGGWIKTGIVVAVITAAAYAGCSMTKRDTGKEKSEPPAVPSMVHTDPADAMTMVETQKKEWRQQLNTSVFRSNTGAISRFEINVDPEGRVIDGFFISGAGAKSTKNPILPFKDGEGVMDSPNTMNFRFRQEPYGGLGILQREADGTMHMVLSDRGEGLSKSPIHMSGRTFHHSLELSGTTREPHPDTKPKPATPTPKAPTADEIEAAKAAAISKTLSTEMRLAAVQQGSAIMDSTLDHDLAMNTANASIATYDRVISSPDNTKDQKAYATYLKAGSYQETAERIWTNGSPEQKDRYEKAVKTYDRFLTDYGDTSFKEEALLGKGETLMLLGRNHEATESLRAAYASQLKEVSKSRNDPDEAKLLQIIRNMIQVNREMGG